MVTEPDLLPLPEAEPPNPMRRPLFEEYLEGRLFRLRLRRSGAVLTLSDYIELRQAGRWNETVEHHWPQRTDLLITEDDDEHEDPSAT
jgi:hypothetical protein